MQIIAAKSNNDIIGINGELPWILPADLKHFRELTTPYTNPLYNVVVMGWKTWVSIGEKPLGNRLNIILSRQKRHVPRSKFVKLVGSATDVKSMTSKKQCVSIIGGESIFRYFLPISSDIYMTEVDITIDINKGDKITRFPYIFHDNWKIVERSERLVDNGIGYWFTHFKKLA